MSFKNVFLGTQHKSYTHDLSFDNNTTMEFGVIQPLLSQSMFPKSTIKVDSRQLVRLAPMPTPSFARMYLANYASFVKMTDVVPYFESLLSKIPFTTASSTYLPEVMPFIDNRTLLYFLMQDAFVDYYKLHTSGSRSYYIPVTELTDVTTILDTFVKNFLVPPVIPTSPKYPQFKWVHTTSGVGNPTRLIPTSADYTLTLGTQNAYMICFKFSNRALRLRKVLLGLGYGLMFNDVSHLSLAPILAFYKAYFDRFGLVRDFPFETTQCFKLIKAIEDYHTDFTLHGISAEPLIQALFKFMHDELSECWYTDANSYIAAHRSSLTNGIELRKFHTPSVQNGTLSVMGVSQGSSAFNYPAIGNSSTSMFTQLSLDVLKRLTAFVNKDSAIGKRMSAWVRVHYGADVSNSLFEQSSRINEWRTNINIDDVFSTSDTANIGGEGKGEFLGSYAGKGSGFSQNGFTFTAPVHGFVFVMACIVPVTNVFQGNDPTLLAVDLDTIPQPEFDALGYEATPRCVFTGDNGVQNESTDEKYNSTFGFVPRYTGFKCKKNVVNGDMFKGYFQTDLLPYFNDRILFNNRVESEVLTVDAAGDPATLTFKVSNNQVPDASTEFQKLCRYNFLGDYDRLFYNNNSELSARKDSFYPVDDNFIVQSVFDVKVSNFLKPVQNSYDTVDDVDNNTTPVSTI